MRSLRLTHEQVQTIVNHARAGAPQEVCGLIAGQMGIAQQIVPIPNRSVTPETHFEMEAIALLKAYKTMDATGVELFAVYHSHPQTSPIPSQTDIRQAMRNMPNAYQLIVSLKQQQAQLQVWHIHNGQVDRVELLVGNEKSLAMPSFSRAQVIAILLATFFAVGLLLLISFSLLPPAPPIPTPQ
jgi:[CysO sulfur-carrier protein]-S-L-cysteine hydrolase